MCHYSKGIHRPKRGPDHDRNGIRLTLEELREEKRATPLSRQEPKAVLPPLAAAGDADAGDYALSTSDRALAVAKVNDLKLLRRAFVGDFLSTGAPLAGVGAGGASGSGGGHGYAATAGLPFGIYKIISRMQAMARGYLTRKRMVEMKAVMRIQAMVRGRIARRVAATKPGGRTFDAFVGTEKEAAKSRFKRIGGAVKLGVRLGSGGGGLLARLSGASVASEPESQLSTPSISDSEDERDEDYEDEDEEEDDEENYVDDDDDEE